jgi:hypothetical protein
MAKKKRKMILVEDFSAISDDIGRAGSFDLRSGKRRSRFAQDDSSEIKRR